MATNTNNNLTWRELLFSVGKLHTLSMQIALHRKVIFMCGGVLSYYAILYAFALWRPGEGFSVEQALNVLVEVPGTVLAIYLTMDMVGGERDKNTLEILFSTAISHYATWSVRIVTICAVLFATLMAMSTISYFFFAEFPFIWGGLNACFPAFFMVGLTFLFSVLCRSSNAAGMIAVGILIAILLLTSPESEVEIDGNTLANSAYDLFLKPFDPPSNLDPNLWTNRVILNRTGIVALGALCIFLALRRMLDRERLL